MAGPALAAAEIETCRDAGATSEARLVACSAVIADATMSGRPKAAAHAYIGDSLARKRDYDGAILAFTKAHEADPKTSFISISAAWPTATKATTSPRWRITTYA